MEYNIRAYVDELFKDAPDTQRAFEMKEELIQNLLDKYSDLVASGKSPEDAYNITIYGIGDISELLEEMRWEEEARGVGNAAGVGISYYEAMYFFRRRRAAAQAIAVALYILSVVPVVVLGVLAGTTGDDFLPAIGVAGMFTFIGAATALIIWGNITCPKRTDPPELVVRMYEQRQKRGDTRTAAFQSSFWCIVVVVYFLISFKSGRWDMSWLVFIAAAGISGILRAVSGQ